MISDSKAQIPSTRAVFPRKKDFSAGFMLSRISCLIYVVSRQCDSCIVDGKNGGLILEQDVLYSQIQDSSKRHRSSALRSVLMVQLSHSFEH